MSDLFVGTLMSTPVQTVAPKDDVTTAAELMATKNIGSVVVMENDQVVGMVTATDLYRLAANRPPQTDQPVENVMTAAIELITADATVEEAAARLRDANINHLPVIEDDELVGIITTTDIAQYLTELQD